MFVVWPVGAVAIGGYASLTWSAGLVATGRSTGVCNLAYKTTGIILKVCEFKVICITLTEFGQCDHLLSCINEQMHIYEVVIHVLYS